MSYGAWERAPNHPDAVRERRAFAELERHLVRASSGSGIVLALLFSVLLHGSLVGSAVAWQILRHRSAPEAPPTVELVDARSLPAFKGLPRIDLSRPPVTSPPPDDPATPGKQIVDLARPATPQEAPPDARYLSEDNHKVAEETKARETAVAPKVLSETFKGTGLEEKATGHLQGKETLKAESDGGEADKTDHSRKGTEGADSRSAPADPFGIRTRSRVGGEEGTGADHDADTLAAGGGTKLAMAGAPNNDYLPGVKMGDATALNSKKDFFASFWLRVERQVDPIWVRKLHQGLPPAGLEKRVYLTRVNVALTPDGALASVELVHGCGMDPFDRAVTEAFREAAPFLNPPRQMVDPDGLIRMDGWGFAVDVTGAQLVHMYGDPRSGKLFPGMGEGFGAGPSVP